MNETTLQGFRAMAETVVSKGEWEVVSPSKFLPSGYLTHAFGLTEERAKDWAKFYKGGIARPMK